MMIVKRGTNRHLIHSVPFLSLSLSVRPFLSHSYHSLKGVEQRSLKIQSREIFGHGVDSDLKRRNELRSIKKEEEEEEEILEKDHNDDHKHIKWKSGLKSKSTPPSSYKSKAHKYSEYFDCCDGTDEYVGSINCPKICIMAHEWVY